MTFQDIPAGYYGGALIIVVILTAWYWSNWHSHSAYLYGFWTADGDAFCEESGVDTMMLFIGENGAGGCRTSYLVITPDSCNQGMELYTRGVWWCFGDSYVWRTRVVCDDVPIWPEYVNITVSKADGTLRIVDDDGVLYASLTKQNDITNTARMIADDSVSIENQ